MSLSSSDTDINKRQRKLQFTSKAVQEEIFIDSAPPCENILSITYLPDECLELIYQSITFGADHSSFGLVCRQWLQIQNNNHESLWDLDDSKCSLRKSPKTSPEIFSKILCKLLTRFQHLKRLSLSGLPEVTDYVTSQSQLFGSKVQHLCLKFSEYPDNNLSLIFSSFPRLTSVCLSSSLITDKGLEILAKCCGSLEKVDLNNCRKVTDRGLESLAKSCLANYCASLKKVDLRCCKKITDKGLEVLAKSCASLENVDLIDCQGITDSGISFLMQNCSKIHSLGVSYCDNVTGIGFVGCRKTLTHVDARFMRILTTEGIKAIVSGGGIQSLSLSGNAVNNEAVITISKGCPLLKSLQLNSCHEVQLEGWKAIGLYCRNLVDLHVVECRNLCDQGLKALNLKTIYIFRCQNFCDQGLESLCYGCNKLSYLFLDSWKQSEYARKIFKRERRHVRIIC
ncbi:hypothetical protein MKW92_035799 [Papaver armeniacum]|nr:hypothetical protein MKW92_035799 [Papaver armeniacum]